MQKQVQRFFMRYLAGLKERESGFIASFVHNYNFTL